MKPLWQTYCPSYSYCEHRLPDVVDLEGKAQGRPGCLKFSSYLSAISKSAALEEGLPSTT